MMRIATFILAGALFVLPCAAAAAEKPGLTVTPLADDFGGGNTQSTPPVGVQSGTQPGAMPGGPGQGTAPAASAGADNGARSAASVAEAPSAKDGMVISYLIDLARKQNKPCPSGKTPPAPPSLIFSEPLCRVADAMGGGKDFPTALAEQGLFAERWRMFSAAEPSAQKVASSLRQAHCEALLEPHTHIGAVRDANGWRIVMAVLTDKDPAAVAQGEAPPAVSEGAGKIEGTPPVQSGTAAPSAAAAPAAVAAPVAAAVPVSAQASPQVAAAPVPVQAQPQPAAVPEPARPAPQAVVVPVAAGAPVAAAVSAPVPAPAPAESAVAPSEGQAAPADAAARVKGQEARALFLLLNDLRVKGGSCLGKSRTTAPPLNFDSVLQASAESDAANAAASGSFATVLGQSPDKVTGVERYAGSNVTKLTVKAGSHASVVLDTWMVSPTRCNALLSSRFVDAGVAYDDGHWVLLLGEKGEEPGARQKSVPVQAKPAQGKAAEGKPARK
ncbi:hypothetical protein LJC26_08025 [Desulfovibrio sp. OttesenSCG-928-O18]|nr:hypothetical protein [Desulfovibrio sp. OttesenSCG-928-O18]